MSAATTIEPDSDRRKMAEGDPAPSSVIWIAVPTITAIMSKA